MRTSLLAAILLVGSAASASEATVNAGESRKPIAPAIYAANYAGMMQQEKLATYGIDLPVGELAKVALLGTFGQTSASGTFNEGPTDSPAMTPALSLFTNYDGQGGRFGDTSIQTVSANPMMSVFASFDLDAKVTVVLLNKSATVSDPVVLGFKGVGQKGDWRAFELTSDGQLSPAGQGTIYDAVLNRTVRPFTALLIEYRPVGGILPVQTVATAPVPALAVVEAKAPEQQQAAGCSSVDAGTLSIAVMALVGLIRRRSQR